MEPDRKGCGINPPSNWDRLKLSRRGDSNLRHTAEVSLQHVTPQPIGDKLAIAGGFDQASRFELFHVVGNSGRAHFSASTKVLARQGAPGPTDLAQQIVAPWVGQCPGNQM